MTPATLERWSIQAPLLAGSGAAWIALLVQTPVCSMHAGMASVAGDSALMFAAMMLPLLYGPIRHVCNLSLARRRFRATALFLAPYAILWTAAGILRSEE